MTDYSALIARVRSSYALTERDAREIADALEAQAKEIEELNEEVNCWAEAAGWPEHSPRQLRARIAELEAENAELSTRCLALFSLLPDEIRIGDIQKAVAALKGEKDV
jgi:chromosome segregation ATPase